MAAESKTENSSDFPEYSLQIGHRSAHVAAAHQRFPYQQRPHAGRRHALHVDLVAYAALGHQHLLVLDQFREAQGCAPGKSFPFRRSGVGMTFST